MTSKEAARTGRQRVRHRLQQQGWKLISEVDGHMWSQYEHPDSGQTVGVNWYRTTGVLTITVRAPCGKLPSGFDERRWRNAPDAAGIGR
ncbi:hypothetical protein ACH4OW_31720 [Streptomyces sp. NPDC017056]|uniref:hypothetical protein n=1 Tax=Streptomyces sp. NPDC017056 TaxID=3364973 RepID=UPI0037B5C5BA